MDYDIANQADQQSALLKTTLEASPNGILVTDLEQRIITYNAQAMNMWDVPQAAVDSGDMSRVMDHVLPLLIDPEALQKKMNAVNNDPSLTHKSIIALKDGRFFELHGKPYRIDGEIVGRITHFVDITAYKKTREKVSEYGNLIDAINTNVNEAILRSTPEKGLVYVNDAFVEIFGYDSKEEVLATDPADFYVHAEKRWQLLKKLQANGRFTNQEVRYRRKDGSVFWGLENSTLVEEGDHPFIDAVVTDIDNWKEAEVTLRKSEQKYRLILKNMEEGYFETNLRGDFNFFNSALVNIMKYDAEDLLGMNYREYMDAKHAERVYQKFNQTYRTGRSSRGLDFKLRCGDGSHIFVDSSLTLRTDHEGNPIGFSGVVRDITDRKQRERQIKNSLREKEVLLSEIHHRVKNNLAIISGLLYLQADQTDDEKASKALTESQNRISSMALIHELLYNNHTFSSLNPRSYIEQLLENIATNLPEQNIAIQTSIKTDEFRLEMNTAIPCALIINELITNAFKYAFEGQDEGIIKIIFQKKEDTYHLEVADNGRGLPAHFDISDAGRHGLGLSLVKTLTRQLNGDITVKNEEGSRFIIIFEDN